MKCIFLHLWTQWEQYTYKGTETLVGPIYGSQRGKTYEVTEERQKRSCTRCGYKQDRPVGA